MIRGAATVVAWLVLMGMAGCALPGRIPVTERSPATGRQPDSYVVRTGDTLYSIAWRLGRDYRSLARANGLRPPYTIYVGQSIRLHGAPGAASPGRSPPPSASRAEPRKPSRAAVSGWRAPTDAPVARGFGAGNRGIDYALAPGRRVRAAAAGDVVYAGSGLGGYLHLIIVKHDPSYLSAYSLDGPVSVREGQRVKAGEVLADMVERGRRNGTLHFEIRRNGDPVDPKSLIGH